MIIELARKEGQKNVERDKEDWAKAVLNKDKEINKIDLTKNWEKVGSCLERASQNSKKGD